MDFCTEYFWINLILFLFGFWMLVRGSDLFVDSASDLARCWHVSELVIGLTLVSIGTSLPELASSVYAAFCNQPDFIVGNIAGSNTANVTMMLGAGLVIASGGIVFSRKLLTRDMVLLILLCLVTIGMVLLGRVTDPAGQLTFGINRPCGILLFLGACVYCCFLFRDTDESEEPESCSRKKHSCTVLLLFSFLALVMIVAGSKLLVDTVVWGAHRMKISPIIISATLVAFGTSVPELSVTIAGVRKGKDDLVLGNLIGSCIFNILMIFGICAAIRPLAVIGWPGLINFYLMLASALLLGAFMLFSRRLTRWMGGVLLTVYAGFVLYNIFSQGIPGHC